MTTTTVSLPANLPPAFQAMIDDLASVATTDALSSAVQIADGILAAAVSGDEEAIFEAANAGTISGENYVDEPFNVRHDAVQWNKTSEQYLKEGAFPYYALVRTDGSDGSPMVLNIGGQSTVPTLYALWSGGVLEKYGEQGMPLIMRVVKTGAGWDLLKLHKYAGKKA